MQIGHWQTHPNPPSQLPATGLLTMPSHQQAQQAPGAGAPGPGGAAQAVPLYVGIEGTPEFPLADKLRGPGVPPLPATPIQPLPLLLSAP